MATFLIPAKPSAGLHSNLYFSFPFMSSLYEESHLKVLRLLESNPQLSQRELAEALGVSVGKVNYCLNALIDKGLVKANRFRNSRNKWAYAYLLTPSGLVRKADLTVKYLRIKIREFDQLKEEIMQLQEDVQQNNLAGFCK